MFPHSTKQYFQLNGSDVCIGDDFYWWKCGDANNPVAAAYRNWMAKSRDICWPARPSWDPITVYAAILGAEEAGLVEESGTDFIDDLGNEDWDTDKTTSNEFNLKYKDD